MKTVSRTNVLQQAMDLGRSLTGQSEHPRRVCRLCCRLFDDLQPLHNMGNTERIWLQTAALLHDIGKSIRDRNHNKISRDLILAAENLPFSKEQRETIALIARYHRGPLPKKSHKHYRDLDSESRLLIRKSAALLRFADGLDSKDKSPVTALFCQTYEKSIRVCLQLDGFIDLRKASSKSNLLAKVFDRKIVLAVSREPAEAGFCC